MKIFYLAVMLISLGINYAKAEFQPAHVTKLKQFSPESPPDSDVSDKSIIKIHFVIEDKTDFSKLGLTGVDICSTLENCERISELNTGVFLKDDSITFGHAQIKSGDKGVYVNLRTASPEVTKLKIVNPLITLNKPIILEKDYGYEAFIKLEKTATGDYQAKYMAYTMSPPVEGAYSVLYEPTKEYLIKLEGGFEVSLPKGATNQPEVLVFHPNRKLSQNIGSLQIIPNITFNVPIAITAKFDFRINDSETSKIKTDKTPNSINKYKIFINHKKVIPEYVDTDANGVDTYILESTNPVLFSIEGKDPFEALDLKSSEAPTFKATAAAASTDACVKAVKKIGNGYYTYIDSHLIARFNSCESVSPYVHMVISKINHSSNTAGISAESAPPTAKYGYKLKTITAHATQVSATVAINGFWWNGDKGLQKDGKFQTGDFAATHYVNGVNVRDGYTKEATIGFTKKTNVSVNHAKFFDRPTTKALNYGVFNYNLLTSTTSIIKKGVCTATKAESKNLKLWSAIGIKTTASGEYLIMLSNTTGNKSYPFDLCQVFKALGVDDAIRSDGGGSTALYFNGEHLNEHTFLDNPVDWGLYGNARPILYGLYVK